MTVARRPEDFAGGDAPADGSGWEIAGQLFTRNPKRMVTRDDAEMVKIWIACRAGEMGGGRLLPDDGGYQDQAAVMMDAIAIMDDQLAALSPKRER